MRTEDNRLHGLRRAEDVRGQKSEVGGDLTAAFVPRSRDYGEPRKETKLTKIREGNAQRSMLEGGCYRVWIVTLSSMAKPSRLRILPLTVMVLAA